MVFFSHFGWKSDTWLALQRVCVGSVQQKQPHQLCRSEFTWQIRSKINKRTHGSILLLPLSLKSIHMLCLESFPKTPTEVFCFSFLNSKYEYRTAFVLSNPFQISMIIKKNKKLFRYLSVGCTSGAWILTWELWFRLWAESSGQIWAAVNRTSSSELSQGRVWVSGSACQTAAQLACQTALR